MSSSVGRGRPLPHEARATKLETDTKRMNVPKPNPATVRDRLEQALAEDGFGRDITSEVTIPPEAGDATGRFHLVAREPGTFCGIAVFGSFAPRFAGEIKLSRAIDDGETFAAGQRLATIEGRIRTVLGVERTMLNFLQRTCGVATLTARYVAATGGTGVRIFDTRKTIPGWRELDKYAVRCGGGHNHRMGLHDAVLIKDNHVGGADPHRLARLVAEANERIARLERRPDFVEVEVDDVDQLRAVIAVPGIDVVLIDNFATERMREAVAIRDAAGLRGRVDLEVSGGVTLENVPAICQTGIDRIAVGALTHSARAVDLGLDRVS